MTGHLKFRLNRMASRIKSGILASLLAGYLIGFVPWALSCQITNDASVCSEQTCNSAERRIICLTVDAFDSSIAKWSAVDVPQLGFSAFSYPAETPTRPSFLARSDFFLVVAFPSFTLHSQAVLFLI